MADPESNPVVLSATDLSANIGDRILLDHQEFLLREGERVGLVGRNGAGKSSLLRILSGRDHFYSGEIAQKRTLRAVYLPPAGELDAEERVRERILAGAARTLERTRHDEGHDARRRPSEVEALEREIAARDGWNLEVRLQELATSLSVPELDRLAGELSGGEKRRVALCKTLIDRPELLLLDEPTNHLDTETIEWLEDYLNRQRGTCLFVTHDRYFLDRVCTRILELQNGVLYSYPGNYTEFLRQKAIREEVAQQNEEKRLAFIRREIDWIRRGPQARGTKSWSRIQRFNDAVNAAPPPVERDVELLMPEPAKFGDIIARLTNVSLERGGRRLFENVSMNFTSGMRLGILGRNGLGKTSMLKLLLGELQPTNGEVRIGERVEMNYIDQHRTSLDDSKTVVEDIGEGNDFVMFGNRKVSVWTYLRRFLFQDEEITTKVGELSGGERNRLLLAKVLKKGGNFLLLDEPTNDLDLSTLRILEESLMNFTGCVAVVSHDRYFLNRVCTDILAFEGENKVVFQHGDYQYYLEKREQRRQAALATEAAKAKAIQQKTTAPAPKPQKVRLTWKEQRELEGMEEAILEAETKVSDLEAIFADPNFHVKYGTRTAELTAQLDSAKAEVEAKYARWEELSAKAAQAQQEK
ncbi:MAG: ABC-F family ATP-binding cassette domain-containing protein [Lentisphaeria bacterium]|nr:ABC-F family ATP-binding cassette domain-containing protein [Lentisphaeria bacterium]